MCSVLTPLISDVSSAPLFLLCVRDEGRGHLDDLHASNRWATIYSTARGLYIKFHHVSVVLPVQDVRLEH